MKMCKDCEITQPFSAFVAKATCVDGYEIRCRKCRSIRYNKSTPALLCKKIYNTQIAHSVTRNHPLPTYTLVEITQWITSQPSFDALYAAWQAASYPKNLAPSVDRLDDTSPYTMGNLQLLSWEANRAKSFQSKRDNTLLVNHRGVTALHSDGTLYKKYASMSEAMREFGGIGTQSWGISSVCNKVQVKDGKGNMYTPKTYKGYSWEWSDQ